MSPEIVAMAIGCIALVLDYIRERRIEQHTHDRIEDHEHRLRVLERADARREDTKP